MISPAVQSAISSQYAALTDAMTHNPKAEAQFLAPDFTDVSSQKLATFELSPVTVMVQKFARDGSTIVVNAQWVGIKGHTVTTRDRWIQSNGRWLLEQRT